MALSDEFLTFNFFPPQTEDSLATTVHIQESGAGALINVGDLSYADEDQPRWDSWARMIQPLSSSMIMAVTAGNHEVSCGTLHDVCSPFIRLSGMSKHSFGLLCKACSSMAVNLSSSFEPALQVSICCRVWCHSSQQLQGMQCTMCHHLGRDCSSHRHRHHPRQWQQGTSGQLHTESHSLAEHVPRNFISKQPVFSFLEMLGRSERCLMTLSTDICLDCLS